MSARVLQVNVSNGGVPKLPVPSAHVGTTALEGDGVNHPKVHGGPERAVCLFPLELIQRLQDEGHPIYPGSIGENLTVAGLDWPALEVDTVLEVGEARLQLTQRVEPCNTIKASFADGQFKRIKPDRAPDETRWYARVLREGTVRPGDRIEVIGA
ncbi:MOSC domain-containing protein [Rubrivirga sp.]|uniref:MOSC domain-containing protein n=1 Tax=Rubrivirga sp. TaxID=1885344 RepID=UPI003C75C4E9